MPGPGLGEGAAVYAAPAKINRFLHVLGRRPDGFHELQTVFQFLDWGDELRIRVRSDEQILLSGDDCGVPAEKNLASRAARLLAEASGTGQGADIELHKNIPPGSGLGGGSSNAATVLLVLNRLWGLHWPLSRLEALGAELGADVPIFIRGRASFAEGRGERLREVAPEEAQICLAIPGVHCATAAVFGAEKLARNNPAIDFADWPCAVATARNDCESTSFSLWPELARTARELRKNGAFRLSGTGCSFFLALPSREKVRKIAASISTHAGRVVVTSSCNVSPLHLQLGLDGSRKASAEGGTSETDIGA